MPRRSAFTIIYRKNKYKTTKYRIYVDYMSPIESRICLYRIVNKIDNIPHLIAITRPDFLGDIQVCLVDYIIYVNRPEAIIVGVNQMIEDYSEGSYRYLAINNDTITYFPTLEQMGFRQMEELDPRGDLFFLKINQKK